MKSMHSKMIYSFGGITIGLVFGWLLGRQGSDSPIHRNPDSARTHSYESGEIFTQSPAPRAGTLNLQLPNKAKPEWGDEKKITEMLQTVRLTDPNKLLIAILESESPDWNKPEYIGILLTRLNKERPDDLPGFIEHLPPGGISEEALAKAFRFFDPKNLARAVDLMNALPFPKWRERAKESIIDGIKNRLEAGELTLEQPFLRSVVGLGFTADQIAQVVASSMSRDSADNVLKAIAAISDPEMSAGVQSSIIGHLDSRVAAELLTKMSTDSEFTNRLKAKDVAKVASMYTASDPSAAAIWATTRLSGRCQETAVSAVIGGWLNGNPIEASKFVGQLQPGAAKDAAITSIVSYSLRHGTSEESMPWISNIQDDKLRANLRERIAAGN